MQQFYLDHDRTSLTTTAKFFVAAHHTHKTRPMTAYRRELDQLAIRGSVAYVPLSVGKIKAEAVKGPKNTPLEEVSKRMSGLARDWTRCNLRLAFTCCKIKKKQKHARQMPC